MKRVLFLVHGIGRKVSTTWADDEIALMKGLPGSLAVSPEAGFDNAKKAALVDAVENHTHFVPLNFDDKYREYVARMVGRKSEFVGKIRDAGFPQLSRLFTDTPDEANVLRDNLFDILIYYAMKDHRNATRQLVSGQIEEKVRDFTERFSGEDIEFSMMAHSLGTTVAHDALEVLCTKPGSNLRYGLGFWFQNIFMVANTSAYLRTEYDPRTSHVRPFLSVAQGKRGYTLNYWDFAHRFDPVAQLPFSYQRYVQDLPPEGYEFVTVDRFQGANIHSLTHYLNDPRVHLPVLHGLYGEKFLPKAYLKNGGQGGAAGGLADRLKRVIEDNTIADAVLPVLSRERVFFFAEIMAKHVKELL